MFGGEMQGIWGVQYSRHRSSAVIPPHEHGTPNSPNAPITKAERKGNQRTLVPNTHTVNGVFAVQRYQKGDVGIELAGRYENQQTRIHFDLDEIERQYRNGNEHRPRPDLSPYRSHALSYSGSLLWDFWDKYRLDLTASHNERIPAPMELYYHGEQLATNSFLYGNKDLKNECSNNYEIGLSRHGDKLSYKGSVYYNDFDNYIYAQNIKKDNNLYMRRFNQAKATIKGLEGQISYQFNPIGKHQFTTTLFGDYTHGRLHSFKDVQGNAIYSDIQR